jgi:Zn-dependent protease
MYAFVYGWKYAVGFVGLIFVHEMGHYLAAKQKGLDVGAPVFIPFVGAWIALKEMPHDAEMEAYIGFAGPLVGTVGALACYFAAREWNSALLLAISYSGFVVQMAYNVICFWFV